MGSIVCKTAPRFPYEMEMEAEAEMGPLLLASRERPVRRKNQIRRRPAKAVGAQRVAQTLVVEIISESFTPIYSPSSGDVAAYGSDSARRFCCLYSATRFCIAGSGLPHHSDCHVLSGRQPGR